MRILIIAFTAFAFILLSGCNEDPASNNNNIQIDPVLAEQAAFGWEVNDFVATGLDVQDLTGSSSPSVNKEISGLAGAAKLKSLAKQLQIRSEQHLPHEFSLSKPMTDSLYFFFDDSVLGLRGALYYDLTTGIARYYEVRYIFPGWRNMTYDSAEIALNLSLTPEDNTDDYLEYLVRLQRFNERFMIQSISSGLIVTDHSGQDVTGFEATIDSWYHQTRHLSHRRQYMKINPDNSGTLREDFDFKDGSNSFNTITFYPDYTGTFARMFRDGTTVSGTFNSIEDDLAGSFSEIIDFPEGRYIDKIMKEALVSLTLPDSIFSADLTRSIYFDNGTIRTCTISLEAYEEFGVKVLSVKVTKGNGAHGEFLIQATESEAFLNGNWTTADNNAYIQISAEYYLDGSSHLNYHVYAMPYTPGDDPILTADYYFSPDGYGEGTITYNGETYLINFDRQDSAELQGPDVNGRINLYYE